MVHRCVDQSEEGGQGGCSTCRCCGAKKNAPLACAARFRRWCTGAGECLCEGSRSKVARPGSVQACPVGHAAPRAAVPRPAQPTRLPPRGELWRAPHSSPARCPERSPSAGGWLVHKGPDRGAVRPAGQRRAGPWKVQGGGFRDSALKPADREVLPLPLHVRRQRSFAHEPPGPHSLASSARGLRFSPPCFFANMLLTLKKNRLLAQPACRGQSHGANVLALNPPYRTQQRAASVAAIAAASRSPRTPSRPISRHCAVGQRRG